MNTKPIPLFDRYHGHPFVPTWRLQERGAQARSRMPLAAPAQPARSVLDSAEHSDILRSSGRQHRPYRAGLPPRKKCLIIGGESCPLRDGYPRRRQRLSLCQGGSGGRRVGDEPGRAAAQPFGSIR
jgi:hypothetical protein